MSIIAIERVPCVCGAPVDVTLADSVNAVRHPHLRQLVLDRRLHRFECGACGRVLHFEKELSYIDVERQQFIHVAPRSDLFRADELVEQTKALYERAFSVGPAPVQALGPQYFVRLCFGYEELREKLLAFDHELNDLVLEVLKCEVLAAEPTMRDSGVLTLYLDSVRDDGSLELRAERPMPSTTSAAPPTGNVRSSVLVQRAFYDFLSSRYDAVLERKARLANGPHVSLLRMIDWPAPAAPSPAPARRSLL